MCKQIVFCLLFVLFVAGCAGLSTSLVEKEDSISLDRPDLEWTVSDLIYPFGRFNTRIDYPTLCHSEDGTLWLTYTHSSDYGKETIFLVSYKDGSLSKPLEVSSEIKTAYQSEIIEHEGTVYLIWSSRDNRGNGQIRWNSFDGEKFSGEVLISEGGTLNRNPSLAKDEEGRIWMAWEHKDRSSIEIVARSYYDGNFSKTFSVSDFPGLDCRRPSLVVDRNNILCVSYDVYHGRGDYEIYLTRFYENAADTMPVSMHPAGDIASSIDVDSENRLWIAWASNRDKDGNIDVPRWFQLRAVKGNHIYEPVNPPTWVDLERDGVMQGFEFPVVLCAEDGKVFIMGRPSHGFYLQYYQGSEWSDLYRVPQDGWGGRGKYLKGSIDPEDTLWLAFRGLGSNAMMSITDWKSSKPQRPKLKPFLENKILVKPSQQYEQYTFAPQGNLNFYFGDIHGHSWMSDGMNDIDEFYSYYRDVLHHDFCSITEHDDFVSNALSPSQWAEIKETTSHYNKRHEFVTLYGQEWTTARIPAGHGHKNIYHIDPAMELYPHKDERFNTDTLLFDKLEKTGAIAIPHHIGWTGIDWESHREDVQPLVEIVSCHGAFEYMGNEPIKQRGGIPGNFVRDGLDRGLRFGFVGGSDSHGLLWHHQSGWKRNSHRTGLTCILAPELSREALFEALKKRHSYATSGIKMRIEWTINENFIMGDVILLESSQPLNSLLKVTSPEKIQSITLVKNGNEYSDQFFEENSGISFDETSRFEDHYITFQDYPGEGEHYYYYRIITENGNMAWTSPIFVEVR